MPRVVALYRYPVKGFTPETCGRLTVLEEGRVARVDAAGEHEVLPDHHPQLVAERERALRNKRIRLGVTIGAGRMGLGSAINMVLFPFLVVFIIILTRRLLRLLVPTPDRSRVLARPSAVGQPPEDEVVGVVEDEVVLHAEAGEGVDVEEAPVVEHLGGVEPVRQLPVLGLQQGGQVGERACGGRPVRGDQVVADPTGPRSSARAVRAGRDPAVLDPRPRCVVGRATVGDDAKVVQVNTLKAHGVAVNDSGL